MFFLIREVGYFGDPSWGVFFSVLLERCREKHFPRVSLDLFFSVWLDTCAQKWLPMASQKRLFEHLTRYLYAKVASKGFPEASFRAFGLIPVCKNGFQGLPRVVF